MTIRSRAIIVALRPEWCRADGQQIRPAEHGPPTPRGFNARPLGELSQLLEPLFPAIRGALRVIPSLFENPAVRLAVTLGTPVWAVAHILPGEKLEPKGWPGMSPSERDHGARPHPKWWGPTLMAA